MLTDFSSLYKGVTLYVSTVPEGQKKHTCANFAIPLKYPNHLHICGQK